MKITKAELFDEFIVDINNEKQQLDFKIEAELRKRGWVHSSSHPGSIWLWSKKIGKRTYHVPTSTAIHMERNL